MKTIDQRAEAPTPHVPLAEPPYKLVLLFCGKVCRLGAGSSAWERAPPTRCLLLVPILEVCLVFEAKGEFSHHGHL